MGDPENTQAQQKPQLWRKGQSGNPAGRPKGSRNKLAEAFVRAVCEDFEAHGVAALQKVRENDPSTYVRVIASLLPKEVDVSGNHTVTHKSEPVSDTARWISEVLGSGSDRPAAESLPH